MAARMGEFGYEWRPIGELPAHEHEAARRLTQEISGRILAAQRMKVMRDEVHRLMGVMAFTKIEMAETRALTAQLETQMEKNLAATDAARLDTAAKVLQAKDPNLTIEQATVKALEADPSLYSDPTIGARRLAQLGLEPQKAAAFAGLSPALASAAAVVRKAAPQLTEEQAMTIALEQNPALYSE